MYMCCSCQYLHLVTLFVYVRSEGSDDTLLIGRLIWVFAGHLSFRLQSDVHQVCLLNAV